MYSIVSAYNPESCANIAVEIKNYTTRVLARNSMSQLYMQVVLYLNYFCSYTELSCACRLLGSIHVSAGGRIN
jgi:hypothetical protein